MAIPGGKGRGNLKCDSDLLGQSKGEKNDKKTRDTKQSDVPVLPRG